MLSNNNFGLRRNILSDVQNKLVNSNPSNFITKLNERENNRLVHSSTDNNCNQVNATNDCPESPHVDYDFNDRKNPFFVTDYVKDIFKHLFEIEKLHPVSKNFLNKSPDSLVFFRSKLINSIVKVQLKYNLNQEVLFLMTQIMDRYLDKVQVGETEMILLVATAFFIAAKYDRRMAVSLSLINKITNNEFTNSEIRRMEIDILKTLDFNLSKPIPLVFLRRFSRIADVNYEEHTLAKYFLEISLLDFGFSTMNSSYLASSALCLALKLSKNYQWNSVLDSVSTYTFKDLRPGMQKLAQLVLKVDQRDYKFKETWKKFREERFFGTSVVPELSSVTIRNIAIGIFD